MRCPEVRDILPLYLMGALDARTRGKVEGHLSRCRECSAQAQEGLEVTARLATLLQQVTPPPYLKERIMARLRPSPMPAGPLQVRAVPLLMVVALASLMGIIALGVTLGLQLRSERREISHLQAMVQEQRVLIYMMAMPKRALALAQGTGPAPQGWGMIMVAPDGKHGLLVAGGLPRLPSDMTYQVWLVREGERVSGGVFRVDDQGWGHLPLRSQEPLWNFRWLGVTMEPWPGSPGPTGPRVLLVELPPADENR